MKTNIIIDSCCDMPIELLNKNNITIIPFTINIDGKEIIDDTSLTINQFTTNMLNCTRLVSAAPSGSTYLSNIKNGCTNFIVTLSSKVSSSFSSALDAKNIAESLGIDVHVFDSKSASAGQLLITLKLIKLVSAGLEKSEIILLMDKYINSTNTYGACYDLTNLIENGKISNIKRKILTALRIRPIIGADDNGEIGIFANARGNRQTISRFINLIQTSRKKTDGENIVITHCNNIDLAERLKLKIKQIFNYQNIIITNTNAVSSMYLNNKGVMIAF